MLQCSIIRNIALKGEEHANPQEVNQNH